MVEAGRPSVARELQRLFWLRVRSGLSFEDAARVVGVAPRTAIRWVRQGGGMPMVDLGGVSGRYLSLAEREEIAIGLAEGCSFREIARRLGRSASTVSREIQRNSATRLYRSRPDRDGRLVPLYRASLAQSRADKAARRPKPARLAVQHRLRWRVQAGLRLRWSPEQIARRLRQDFPDAPEMWVSHETIYQALYVQGRGALRRELGLVKVFV
jgi:IS30 family transposase